MLTEQMKRTYDLIERGINERGVAPSYREIAAELGLKSLNGVNRIVRSLEERGMISRIPGHARAIALGSNGYPTRKIGDRAAILLVRNALKLREAGKISGKEALKRIQFYVHEVAVE